MGDCADMRIDEDAFCVVAALAKRVNALDRATKDTIKKLDLNTLSSKMATCKELFYCGDQGKQGKVTVDHMRLELKSGGLPLHQEEHIIDQMSRGGTKEAVTFVDFLSCVPLFVQIHETIIENPFDRQNVSKKEEEAGKPRFI